MPICLAVASRMIFLSIPAAENSFKASLLVRLLLHGSGGGGIGGCWYGNSVTFRKSRRCHGYVPSRALMLAFRFCTIGLKL
jgi:hypothetical protein